MKLLKNKKGGVIYYFILFALFLTMGYGIYLSAIQTEGLSHTGESSQRILSTTELANRVSSYIDISIDQSIKKSILSLEENSGFLIEISSDYETEIECGQSVFPILNNEKQEVECFPQYLETLEKNFQKELTPKLHQFDEIPLSRVSFTTNLKTDNKNIILQVYSSPIQIPIYSTFTSYYDASTKSRMEYARPINEYIKDTETGYYMRGGLTPHIRINPQEYPDSIVLHYTAGHRVDDAYNTLKDSSNSYHYIIEKNGDVYNFLDELSAGQHAGCDISKQAGNSCKEGYNQRSIAISLVNLGHSATNNCQTIQNYHGIKNKCWEYYTEEQIDATIQLIADIIERQAQQNNFIKLNAETITTHQEIDPTRKWDPGPMFLIKEDIITRVKTELQKRDYPYEI